MGDYNKANKIYSEAIEKAEQHTMIAALWRDWMLLCFQAYKSTKVIDWAQSAVALLPYALKYKPHKTKMLLAPFFGILKEF